MRCHEYEGSRERTWVCKREQLFLRVWSTDAVIAVIDDSFILYLFQLIEQLSDDADDPYHYPIIRVLVRLLAALASYCAMSKFADEL